MVALRLAFLAPAKAATLSEGEALNFTVAPAFTATRLTRDRLEDHGFAAALANRVALGRAATPEDVARAVLFVAGPDAAYITGAVIPVDGGTTASTGQPRPL